MIALARLRQPSASRRCTRPLNASELSHAASLHGESSICVQSLFPVLLVLCVGLLNLLLIHYYLAITIPFASEQERSVLVTLDKSMSYKAETHGDSVTSWIPLTTPFTAPSSCSSLFQLHGYNELVAFDPGYGVSIDTQAICQPPAVTTWWLQDSIFDQTGLLNTHTAWSLLPFSCPSGFETAASSLVSGGESTLAFCCPRYAILLRLHWAFVDDPAASTRWSARATARTLAIAYPQLHPARRRHTFPRTAMASKPL